VLAAADDKDRHGEGGRIGCAEAFMQQVEIAVHGAGKRQIDQALCLGCKFNGEFEMSICENFKTGKTYIDGVMVTPENREELIAKNFRAKAGKEIEKSIAEIQFLWRGKRNLPERDRVISILNLALTEVTKG
jgi:tRNA threonylcarbamoyladenosine modification (KEOPS) complex Cgi121 subunit